MPKAEGHFESKWTKTMNPLCIFCYKPIITSVSGGGVDGKEEISKFFNLLSRLLKLDWNVVGRCHRLCEDCTNLGNSFSNLYFQLECVTLQLNWKVRRIMETMSYAGKVPSRLAAFSEHFGGDEESQKVGKRVRELRKKLLSHCKLHLKSGQPKVIIKRLELEASYSQGVGKDVRISSSQQETPLRPPPLAPPEDGVENGERLLALTLTFLFIRNLLQPCSTPKYDNHSMEDLDMELDDDEDVREEPWDFSMEQEQKPVMMKSEFADDFQSRYNDMDENCSNGRLLQQIDDNQMEIHSYPDPEEKQQLQIMNVRSDASISTQDPQPSQSFQLDEAAPTTEHLFPIRKSLRPLLKCQQCSKTFSDQNKLSSHLETHTDPKVAVDTDNDKESNSESEKVLKVEKVKQGTSDKQTISKRKFRKGSVNNKKVNPPASSSSSSESESNDDDIDDDNDEPQIKRKTLIPNNNKVNWPKPDFLPPTQCEICQLTFSCQPEVEKHRVFDHKLTSFVRCQGCGLNFCRFTSLRRHRNNPHFVDCYIKDIKSLKTATESEFPRYQFNHANKFCPKEGCLEIFAFQEHLEIHLNTHGSWSCPVCDIVFEKAHHLARHEMSQHQNELGKESSKSRYKFHCPRSGCKGKTKTKRFMVSHILSEHLGICIVPSGAKRQCPVCKVVLRSVFSKKDMEDHVKREHDVKGMDPSQVSKCKICYAPFVFANSLTRHMRSVHKKIEKSELVLCPNSNCGKRLKGRVALAAHLKKVHKVPGNELPKPGFAVLQCSVCKEKFERQGDLNNHMNSHKEADKLVFRCEVCEAICKTKDSLNSHMKNMHEGPKETVCCEQCGKVFRDKLKLRLHVGKSHTDPSLWKFVCPEEGCGRRLFTKQRLTAHLRTHTKERPYVCDFCGSAYSYQSTLRAHLQNIHGPTAAATLPKKRFTKPFDQRIREKESGNE